MAINQKKVHVQVKVSKVSHRQHKYREKKYLLNDCMHMEWMII